MRELFRPRLCLIDEMPHSPGRLASLAQAALWLIPACLLIQRNSAWTPVATVAFVLSLAGLSGSRRLPPDAPLLPSGTVISPPLAAPPWKPLLHLAFAGAFINAAMLAESTHRAVAAGLCGAAAATIILHRSSPAQRHRLAARHRRISIALAMLLTIFGLLGWGARRWLPSGSAAVLAASSSSARRAGDLSFRAVILFVDKAVERLAAPPPLTLQAGFADPRRQPLVIPFSGVYWFLRAPDRLPPPTSLVRHGSPDSLFFRAADLRPLTMEAHQHLGRQINLACCSGLDLDLTNVDQYPGSVHVELILSNTTSAASPHQSLGIKPVQSTEFRIFGERQPRQETIHYTIPANRLGAFDEITVRFHLSRDRDNRSARLAIQRFTLKPRGSGELAKRTPQPASPRRSLARVTPGPVADQTSRPCIVQVESRAWSLHER